MVPANTAMACWLNQADLTPPRAPLLWPMASPAPMLTPADSVDFMAALSRMGLLAPGERPTIVPLTGGVSSAIVRVDLRSGPICLKRALAKLKVAADWQVSVERNRWEREWLRVAGGIIPEAVPLVLGEDPETETFAMNFFPPTAYPVWKARLLEGHADPAFADQVGERLAKVHAATARQPELAARFPTDELFHALRLDPYLASSARAVPSCAEPLHALIAQTTTHRLALVHGSAWLL